MTRLTLKLARGRILGFSDCKAIAMQVSIFYIFDLKFINLDRIQHFEISVLI